MTANGTPATIIRRYRLNVPDPAASGTDGIRPAKAHADAVVSGLRCTPMFALAVDVFRQHRRDGGGRCRSCGNAVCRTRRHAATIIEAAGVNPADFDAPSQRKPWRRDGLSAPPSHSQPPARVRRHSLRRPFLTRRGQTRGPAAGSPSSRRDRPRT